MMKEDLVARHVNNAIRDYQRAFNKKLVRSPIKTLGRVILRRTREMNVAKTRTLLFPEKNLIIPSCLRPASYTYAGKKNNWFEEYFFENARLLADNNNPRYLPIFLDHIYLHAQAGSFLPGEFSRIYRQLWCLLNQISNSPNRFFVLLGIYEFPVWQHQLFPTNILVFSAAGYGDVAIPLLKGERAFRWEKKSIPVSFMGNLGGFSDADGTRSEMAKVFQDVAYISQGPDWEDIMSASVYSLAPRGQGPTSFRLFEAIALGSIPIYIWKTRKWLPYEDEVNWNEFSIICEDGEMEKTRDWILSEEGQNWARGKRDVLESFHDKYLTYRGVFSYIQRKLDKLGDPQLFDTAVANRSSWFQ